ncbi:MAG: Holliday junction branch migration protein RuvA [Planctomycetes bacterium]|nr:Holliday junction branch migration protein RuvA [Planctomycetota bacterium]
MYDHILGEVTEARPARVVLRAAGVGYELQVPTGVSSALAAGTSACLFTILNVTDGHPTLLGFTHRSDRELARMLLSVSGVGPAMCLALLSAFPAEHLVQALATGNHGTLKQVKGVGTKTAERLCLELRDKVAKLDVGGIPVGPATVLMPPSSEDAVAALITLGVSEKDARKKVLGHHQHNPEATTEELIKAVLRG